MEKQLSEEWFEKRKGRITGSRVGAILGLSPFAKPADVLRSMVREYHNAESEFTGNIATEWGNDNEDKAIAVYEISEGAMVISTGFHIHGDMFGASPDGFVGDDGLIEVKCPFGKRYKGGFKSIHDQPHYYAQVQMGLLATDRKWCDFFQWSTVTTLCERVERDYDWLDSNIEQLESFYNDYLEAIESPDDYIADLIVDKTEDEDWLFWENKYKKNKMDMDLAKNDMDIAKDKLIELANGKDSQGYLSVKQVNRTGSVNYKKLIGDNCPDVDAESYRGKSSSYWKIAEVK
jgi:exodeoxyribonuclease (lambda-induced)